MLSSVAIAEAPAHFAGPMVGGFGFLFLVVPLFWIALFVVIFAVARRRRAAWFARAGGFGHPGFGHFGNPAHSAESTLAERFAQGDIDEKDYRARLEVLRANSWPKPPVS